MLKGISPEYSLDGLMLKLMLQDFGHLMQRVNSLGDTLMLRKIEGGIRKEMRWSDGLIYLMDMTLSNLAKDREVYHGAVHYSCKERVCHDLEIQQPQRD